MAAVAGGAGATPVPLAAAGTPVTSADPTAAATPCKAGVTHAAHELIWYTHMGRTARVEHLLRCMAAGRPCAARLQINSTDEEGSTALVAAAWDNRPEIMELLLRPETHIDVNARNRTHSWTALHAAAARGHLRCVELLLARSDIDLLPVDLHGHRPLMYARYYNHAAVAEALERAIQARAESGGGSPTLIRQCQEHCIIV